MKVGFTGTQSGMNTFQRLGVHKVLNALKKNGYGQFHHGDCIGADKQSDEIANDIGFTVILHPPKDPKKRAFCKNAYEVRDEKEYLERNHDIVDETDIMIATPNSEIEQVRSGTWATIRYARKTGKTVIIIYPNKIKIEKGK